MAIWAYLLFALGAGVMLPIQFGINAQLAAWVGGSVRAAFVSFVVGNLKARCSTDNRCDRFATGSGSSPAPSAQDRRRAGV